MSNSLSSEIDVALMRNRQAVKVENPAAPAVGREAEEDCRR
jgi:hypothetical protein